MSAFWLDEPVVEGFREDMLLEALQNVSVAFDEHKHPRDFRGRWAHHLGASSPHTGVTLPDGTRIQKHKSGDFAVHRNGRITRHATTDSAVDEAVLRSARGTEPESYGGAVRHKNAEDAFHAEKLKGAAISALGGAKPAASAPAQPGRSGHYVGDLSTGKVTTYAGGGQGEKDMKDIVGAGHAVARKYHESTGIAEPKPKGKGWKYDPGKKAWYQEVKK